MYLHIRVGSLLLVSLLTSLLAYDMCLHIQVGSLLLALLPTSLLANGL